MIKLIEINTAHEHYPFMEALLETAFPLQERRDSTWQRRNVNDNPLFHNILITDDEHPVGLLTYWDFKDFIYIEHFAIDHRLRNNGYGQQTLSVLKEQTKLPIVLEAEEPTDELTKRRIGFYRRQGFILQDFSYQQPPYRPEDKWFPMKLMTFGIVNMANARDIIYREVYQVKR
ncbi:MAG: GNAT family N-acetyltransferase [Bacteroidaceae bacterium]|nr:GNAT family N-acetyltransferase [Bacteroidaceae bacterium]